MNVTGKYAMVFRNEKNGKVFYTLSDSSKNIDQTYTNRNWFVRFAQGNEPNDRSKIKYEGFMSYWKKDENTIYETIQITSWDYMDGATSQGTQINNEQLTINKQHDTSINVTDDDLPF